MTLPEGTASPTSGSSPLENSPSSKQILRNFFSLSVAALMGRFITLLLSTYMRHILGAAAIGQLAWSASVVSYAGLLVSSGLEVVARREVARDSKQAARYTVLMFGIQALLALLSLLVLQIFSTVSGRAPQMQTLLLLNAVALLFVPLDIGWLLYAHERLRVSAIVSLTLIVIQCGVVFALVRGPQHLFLYVLLPYPFRLAGIAFGIWYCVRHGLLDVRDLRFKNIGMNDVRRLMKAALPIGLAQTTVLLYGNSDVIFLGFSHSNEVVGFYSTAYSMMLVPTLLHSALSSAYFSSLARAFATPERARALSQQFLRLMIWLGFPLAALGWAVGRHPMLLLFGAGFAPSGPLFEWLCLNLAPMFFNVGYLIPLIAWEHQNMALRCTLTGALVNVGLNLWLIPHFGASGAVVSTLAAEAAVCVVLIWVRRHIHPLPWPRFLWPPVLMCLLVAPLTRFATDHWMPWWLAALAGASVCLAVCALCERNWTRKVLLLLRRGQKRPNEASH